MHCRSSSATDWVAGGWDIDESVELSSRLKQLGVDLIDVSSGGMVPHARIPVGKGFQVSFARRIRGEAREGSLGWTYHESVKRTLPLHDGTLEDRQARCLSSG